MPSPASVLQKLYSKLADEAVNSPLKKATRAEWGNYLRNRGVKKEELENLQRVDLPEDKPILKDDFVKAFQEQGDVPLEEARLTYNPSPDDIDVQLARMSSAATRDNARHALSPKYGSQYSLPGGFDSSYDELVLTSPWASRLAPDAAHYTDVPGGSQNIGWLRFNTRYSPTEELQFHLDEVQSARHQDALKTGYSTKDLSKAESDELTRLSLTDRSPEEQRRFEELTDIYTASRIGVPDAPFKGDNWKNLLTKRALLEAADQGADIFSWAPGKMQAQRWSQDVDSPLYRMYDKELPNSLMKELKKHGATKDDFFKLKGNSVDLNEVDADLAAFVSQPDGPFFEQLFFKFHDSPAKFKADLANLGLTKSQINQFTSDMASYKDRLDFIESISNNEDQMMIDQMEAMVDFADDLNEEYFKNLRWQNDLPAVRLSPEVRQSILEKGFPKYMLPFGAAGLSGKSADALLGDIQTLEEPQEFAAGGLVKKLAKNKTVQDLMEVIEEGTFGNTRPVLVQKNPDTIDTIKAAAKYGKVQAFTDPQGARYIYTQYDDDVFTPDQMMQYYGFEPKEALFRDAFFMNDGALASEAPRPSLHQIKKFLELVE